MSKRISGLLLLGLATACGRVGFDAVALTDGQTADDGAPPDAPMSCQSWSTFSVPVSVTELNTTSTDWAPSVSADGLVMTYTSASSGNEELYRATRSSITEAWTPMGVIQELKDPGDEEDDPTITADGLEVYFGKARIYVATRASTAVPFGSRSVIVSEAAGFSSLQGAELTRNDLTIYFNALSPTLNKIFVIQRANRSSAFGLPIAIEDPDSGGDAGYPTLSADELDLWYASDRTNERKIRHSTRASRTEPFSEGIVVTELDSNTDEWDPEISFDGTTIWFSSARGGSSQDIYVATRTCLTP